MATFQQGLNWRKDPQTIASMTAVYRELAAKRRDSKRKETAAYYRYLDELREQALHRSV